MLICFYQCRACGLEFDIMLSLGEVEENAVCPRCGNRDTKKTAAIAASCSGTQTSPSGDIPEPKS